MSRYIGSSLSIGLLCLAPRIAQAQNTELVIQPGTTMGVAGNALVLNNLDLYCNGSLAANTGTVWFTGGNNTSYNGTGIVVIRKLQLNTGPGTTLSLNNSLEITGSLNFTQGLIDLNGQQIQLKGSGTLQGENETNRITGVTGGSIVASASGVDAPDQLNIGNLGAMLTSSANLGRVSILRVHIPASFPGSPPPQGIQRTYLIQPTNDAGLNATLRFYYLDAELNSNDTGTLVLWRSPDGVNWTQVGFDSRNSAQKYVEKRGLSTLSYWTLADASDPLVATQATFKVSCEGPVAIVQWATGEETNLDYFLIQRSSDGAEWRTLNKVAATNNPTGSSYVFKDNQPAGNAYYRLAIADQAGTVAYSPAFSGGCADIPVPLMIYPNPAESQAIAQVSVRQAALGMVVITDMSGQRVYQTGWSLQAGINQLTIPVVGLAAGNYIVRLILPGAPAQQAQLMKK
jgi:hypothetical protein